MRHLSLLFLLGPLSSALFASQEEAPATEPVAEWTVLVYGAVDNDWEQPFMRDIRGMRKGLGESLAHIYVSHRLRVPEPCKLGQKKRTL